jgi:hypothetical protein
MGGFIGLCHGRMLLSARGRKSETSIPPLTRGADFQVCCVAGFQTRCWCNLLCAADLEVGDTAGLETRATKRFMVSFDLQHWTRIGAMNPGRSSWKRWLAGA